MEEKDSAAEATEEVDTDLTWDLGREGVLTRIE